MAQRAPYHMLVLRITNARHLFCKSLVVLIERIIHCSDRIETNTHTPIFETRFSTDKNMKFVLKASDVAAILLD